MVNIPSILKLRTMPKIRFKLDTSIHHSMRVEEILKRIAEENRPEVEKGGEDSGK